MDNPYVCYLLFVFLAFFGVLQIVAAYAELRGLSFFKTAISGYIFGILIIGVAFSWFFGVGGHIQNVPVAGTEYKIARVEGSGQWGLSCAAVVIAFLLTIVISFLTKRRALSRSSEEEGVDALKDATYLELIRRKLRR
jgi:amino acid transporter